MIIFYKQLWILNIKKVYFTGTDIFLQITTWIRNFIIHDLKISSEEIERLKTIGHLNEIIFSKPEDIYKDD